MPIMLRSSRCILSKFVTEEDYATANECPYDPGGYFVVRGAEKVVLMHEQMSKNRIMITRTAKKELVCEVMSSTTERKSKTYVISYKGRYYVRHNLLTNDVPISVIFKAMGYESDLMIVSSSKWIHVLLDCWILIDGWCLKSDKRMRSLRRLDPLLKKALSTAY